MKLQKSVRRLSGIVFSLLLAAPAFSETSLWKINRGDSHLLIGGTIHMLKASDYPLPKEYAEAFTESELVYFETDMMAIQDPVFGMKMAQAMLLPEGKTLESVLNPVAWRKLKQFFSKANVPIESMQMFEPAFVGIMLSMLEMQKLGFSDGIDAFYFDKAQQANKTLGALETPDEQLQFMVDMTKVDPNIFIESTLYDLENLSEIMDDTVAAWRSGNVDLLDDLLGKRMREEVPALYQAILVKRNEAWITEIERLLDTPDVELMLVGAMHLAGPDSVLALLKKRGITVARYQP